MPTPCIAALRAAIITFAIAVLAGASALAQTPAAQPPSPGPVPQATTPAPAKAPDAQPAQPAPPQPAVELPATVLEPVARLTSAIEEAEKEIQNLAEIEQDLRRLRSDAEAILSDSSSTADDLRPRLADVKALIEKLGPPPAKDQPPEAPAIAAERARLNALAAQLDGAIKSTELTWARARQLIERITVMRHSLFTKNLMQRMHSPVLPQVWRDLSAQIPHLARRVSYQVEDWQRWALAKRTELGLVLLGAVLAFAILRWLTGRFIARHRRRRSDTPSFFERGMSIAWATPLAALPAIAALVILYVGLDTLDLLYPPWSLVAEGVFFSGLEIVLMTSLIRAVMAPGEARWRIVPLDDRAARALTRILYSMTIVYSLDGALAQVGRAFLAPLTLTVVQSFAASLIFAMLLIWAAVTPFTPMPQWVAPPEDGASAAADAAPVSRHQPLWLKLALWVLALGVLAAAALGYVALARFMSQQIVLTGMVIAVVWLLYLAIRALTREPRSRKLPVTEVLEHRFGLDEPRRNQLARLTEAALTLALVICAVPVLMLQWGFSGADIRDWFKALLFGMEIGSFKISLARILIGIVLFIALLFTTRLFQHWLKEKALKETRLDQSIIESIDTVVGYACVTISALIAVSYAGFDVTSLAIVAGALSVGIGFGLQSIVNNFVSGLILLIERPVKVGDRIVVGTEQGYVRRISVRATEVETFDKASLIIPNSELITGRVLNWTHRNKMGAANVKVGVAYTSDPDRVIEILQRVAAAHPGVLTTPAPWIGLDNFGDSALSFTLRVSLPDIDQAGTVQSELRMAILKEFHAAGIEIPYNTVDVNLRDLDGVKRYLQRMLEERAAQRAAEKAAGPGPSVDADAGTAPGGQSPGNA
ncbi:MAG: DUF3772 domain-containing protein [Hyphomicrobiaceae bacterium]|nr:DUF3772 domain-containing protein [Hyphomicrobiaceae bacterium]